MIALRAIRKRLMKKRSRNSIASDEQRHTRFSKIYIDNSLKISHKKTAMKDIKQIINLGQALYVAQGIIKLENTEMNADKKINEVFSTWKAQIQRKINAEKNPLIKDLLEKQLADYTKYFETLEGKK